MSPRPAPSFVRRAAAPLSGGALLVGVATALWWSRAAAPLPPPPASKARPPETGIVTSAVDVRKNEFAYPDHEDAVARPADPALEEALSMDTRLAFPFRLKALHALRGAPLSAAQARHMRAFVADPRLPAGLSVEQVRALKNDVLNLLCVHSGGEAETATMLRALHADSSADPGLRDYALQHLATLAEQDPALGWSSHWAAIEGADADLAATALIHLAIRHRAGGLGESERARVETAALRLAANVEAKEPARATALQVCGRLKLGEASALALSLARSERAGLPLRIAAVATLGDLGGGDAVVRDYLRSVASGSEVRLRAPARSALSRLSSS